MDNRFLFRGKDRDNGEWRVGGLAHVGHKLYIDTTPTDGGMHNSRIDPATVGQCTGLFASKSYRGDSPEDLLIFEGDICKDSLEWEFKVIWDDENARFLGCHEKPRGDTYICYVGREPRVEIIGNIHDNPAP